MQPSGRPVGPDPHNRRPAIIAVAIALAIIAVTVPLVFVRDYSGGGADASRVPLSTVADLSGQSYVVGGKNISAEQGILCEITVAALRAARADATGRCSVGGTGATRRALLTGEVDLYWEYTGTAWQVFLGQDAVISDPAELYEQVRTRDLQENGVVWADRADFDDTYAFAVSGDTTNRLAIDSISGMAAYIRSGAPGDVCVEREYRSRPDGLANLQRAYGFTIPPDRLRVLDTGDIYQATANGQCLFGEVFSTDGRIPDLKLSVLTDDRNYHVTYNPAPTIRKDAYDRNPDVAKVLAPIARALDYDTILGLNAEVSAYGEDQRDVARRWLSDQGFIASS